MTVRDGTRLAVDLFRPTRGGKAVEERLPVVWTHTPYRRAVREGGTVYTVLDTYGWLKDVLRHGYVVACVDARGTGMSFGTFDGMFNPKETQDSYDVTEWLAAQSWSDGNVGMYGQSYLAITQYMAASRKPLHLRAPQRISIGPWVHSEESHFDYTAAHLRWWDYWLKGIDNGVMREEPVHYYLMGAPEGQAWKSARTWPLPQERRTAYWFGRRSREGALGLDAPREKGAKDEMTVDESASVAPNPRWTTEPAAPDLAANDAKGLSYTTAPLAAPLEVTGHPVVHLWISASAPDVDVFVYLEEVDAKGGSRYVSEGALRASHRATADPGYDLMGLPTTAVSVPTAPTWSRASRWSSSSTSSRPRPCFSPATASGSRSPAPTKPTRALPCARRRPA